jgi:enoyl-CoA hydratase/carnithine racemase
MGVGVDEQPLERCWSLQRDGRVAVATFRHPPRNFMTFATMTELEALVDAVAADDTISVLVLASELPGYFVARGDLEDLVRLGRGDSTVVIRSAPPRNFMTSSRCRRSWWQR